MFLEDHGGSSVYLFLTNSGLALHFVASDGK